LNRDGAYAIKDRMSLFRILILLIPLTLPIVLPAGAVRLDLQPRSITQDDSASLILTAENMNLQGAPQLELPEGLRIIASSRQQQLVGGQISSTVTMELKASAPGTYQIGPFQLQDGTRIDAMTLEVRKAELQQSDPEISVSLDVRNDTPYVQQPITLMLTVESLHPVEQIELLEFEAPGLEISAFQELAGRSRRVDGELLRSRRFSARAIPLREGRVELQPTLKLQVLEPAEVERNRMGMFSRRYRARNVRLKPEALSLEVESPPLSGRPESFEGHVGQFQLSAEASPLRLSVGDPVTLKLTLEGSGSIRQALPPKFEESDDFQVYDPRLIEEELQQNGLSGQKIQEQVLIPKHAGLTEIPALEFSFFNPDLGRYERIQVGPFPLQVEEAVGPQNSQSLNSLSTLPPVGEREELGSDLIYVKRDIGTLRPLTLALPLLPLSMTATPLLLLALFSLTLQQRKRQQSDFSTRKRQQHKILLSDFRQQLSQAEDAATYFDLFAHTQLGLLRLHLHLPPGSVDESALEGRLSSELIQQSLQWMQRCDRARFAAGAEGSVDLLRKEMLSYMDALEQELSE